MQEVIEEFSIFDNWEDKYIYIIELGKKLQPIPYYLRSEDKLILGCHSRVWLHAYVKQNKICFQAYSDAIIPRGLIALMLRLYSGRFLDHLIYSEPEFILKIGLSSFLSPIRANGMEALFKQIKQYALAFKCLPVNLL